MSAYPCTKFTIHENIVVTVHGPYISTFDLSSGILLQSTAPSINPSREAIPAASFIINVAVTLSRRRLVSVDQQKSLKVWDLDTLDILSSRELPKKANQALLTDDGETILVADKFGDVFSYPLVAPEIPKVEPKAKANMQEGRKSLASHSNPSLGTLVLGHTSSLTTMLLTPDDQFLITADRDEHIRVSHYPKGYNIERFCMGHTKYVSALHLPHHLPGNLVSAGGDRHLFLWDYLSGQLKDQLEIRGVVYASTKVSSQRRKFRRLETKAGTGWRARRRKEREMEEEEERLRRKKEKQGSSSPAEQGQADVPNEDEYMLAIEGELDDAMTDSKPEQPTTSADVPDKMVTDSTHLPGGMVVGAARASLPSLEDVIVISQIATVRFESQYALVFSATGANAIFFAPCNAVTRWGPEEHVHQFNLPYPLLSFDVESLDPTPESSLHRNRIWVTLDQTFLEDGTIDMEVPLNGDTKESTTEVGKPRPSSSHGIYVLEWQGSGTMNEVTADSAPLLRTLRSLAAIPASRADIQTLDLYGLLTSLPKTEELEEPDGPSQEEPIDFAMEKSDQASPARVDAGGHQALMNHTGGAQADNAKEGVQTREVKKSGRKKWQDKMESRQQAQSHDSQVVASSKATPSSGHPPSPGTRMNEEASEFGGQANERVKGGTRPSSNTAAGRVRKASDLGRAANSDGPASKKIKVDDPGFSEDDGLM